MGPGSSQFTCRQCIPDIQRAIGGRLAMPRCRCRAQGISRSVDLWRDSRSGLRGIAAKWSERWPHMIHAESDYGHRGQWGTHVCICARLDLEFACPVPDGDPSGSTSVAERRSGASHDEATCSAASTRNLIQICAAASQCRACAMHLWH